MGKINEILKGLFRNALLNEARVLPSEEELAALPSIYKGIATRDIDSYIENGFQHQLAGGGGKAVGEGVYSRLTYRGALNNLRYYGPAVIEGKVLGGFKNYIMFDANSHSSIKHEIIKYYGSYLTPEEQIRSIVNDKRDADTLAYAGKNMNSGGAAKLCRKYGIRGLMYNWDNSATVLPFDFSTVIVWAVARNANYDTTLVKVFNDEARERYEKSFDWDFQLFGRYDRYDRDKITRVSTNNEMYVIVQDYGKGYNIVHLDTRIVTNPKPREISDIWFREPPSLPSINTGIFSFNYMGMTFFGTVCACDGKPGLWFPEDISKLYRPNIHSASDWIDLDLSSLQEIYGMLRNEETQQKAVTESLKKSFRNFLNEEIVDNSEEEFFANNRCTVYVCTHKYSLDGVLENGFSRQFANDNDKNNNGGSLTYGDGVYGSVSFENARDNLSRKKDYQKPDNSKYGTIILKCKLLGGWSNFLIFDEKLAKIVYGEKWRIFDQIDSIIADDAAKQELKNYVNRFSNCELYNPNRDSMRRTNHVIFNMFGDRNGFKRWTNFFRKNGIRGCVYHGHGDGYCFVCYNYADVIPFAYSVDGGNTFIKSFDFDAIKERSFKNADAVQKFGHLYYRVSKNPVSCVINGQRITVATVETFNHKYNLIDVNTDNGEKISPIDFDSEPSVGINGLFSFTYNGVEMTGIVLVPGTNSGGIWYPEDPSMLRKRPTLNNISDWVDFQYMDEIAQLIKNEGQ